MSLSTCLILVDSIDFYFPEEIGNSSVTESINQLQLHFMLSLLQWMKSYVHFPVHQIPFDISRIWSERHRSKHWPSLSCIIIFPSWLHDSQQHCISFLLIHYRLPRIKWFKRILTYYLTVLGVRNQKWICRAVFLLEALEKNSFICLFQLPEATCLLGSWSFSCLQV